MRLCTRPLFLSVLLVSACFGVSCSRTRPNATGRESTDAPALEAKVSSTFSFVAFGDTRFHDPSDTTASNPAVRHALVTAIERDRPAFVSIGGDIVYVGESAADWNVYDSETRVWREQHIPVYPALGNHELKGDRQKALRNYFTRFPELQDSLFYSVRTENCVLLMLDSNRDELSGAQGRWLRSQLGQVPASSDFVFLVFHHPVFTSSSDGKMMTGGHAMRPAEEVLGQFLEEQQKQLRARIIVFNGHVHNYERHEHGGIAYFVTGGGGAHAYPITRKPDDPYRDPGINYHYLLVKVDHRHLTVTMNRLQFEGETEVWTQPDRVSITAPEPVVSSAK